MQSLNMAVSATNLPHTNKSTVACEAKARVQSALRMGCDQCNLLPECGGLDDLDRANGCFSACHQRGCGEHYRRKGKPAWICPCNQELYVQALRETGGWDFNRPEIAGPATNDLPRFVPTIQHKSSRREALDIPFVALPLPEVLGFVRRTTAPLTPQLLRQEFRLAADCQIILVCACVDKSIEQLWAVHNSEAIAHKLAALGLWAATFPNYSFFIDAPRPDSIINRRRSLIIGGEWTDAGVPVIPHLNALTIADWKYWRTFLEEQPHINYVAKEFQTGLHDGKKGLIAIQQLAHLQDELKRELRPVIVGGTKYLSTFARYFDHPTFVESTPFMLAVQRQRITNEPCGENNSRSLTTRKEAYPLQQGQPIDELLRANIITRQTCIENAWSQVIPKKFRTLERKKIEVGVPHLSATSSVFEDCTESAPSQTR